MEREPIVDRCQGCRRAEGNFCSAYAFPSAKWRSGSCPMATHLRPKAEEGARGKRGQQKQPRRNSLSKKQQESYSRLGDGGR